MAENTFWTFLTRHYSDAAVEECCLYLQDKYQASVVFILWLCWLDRECMVIDEALYNHAMRYASSFDQGYLVALRTARRKLKNDNDIALAARTHLRREMLDTELSFERVLANYLYELTKKTEGILQRQPGARSGTTVSSWLSRYLLELKLLDCDGLIKKLNP